jgi:hypothetical protein
MSCPPRRSGLQIRSSSPELGVNIFGPRAVPRGKAHARLACAEALGADINRPVAAVSVDVCEEDRMNFGEAPPERQVQELGSEMQQQRCHERDDDPRL